MNRFVCFLFVLVLEFNLLQAQVIIQGYTFNETSKSPVTYTSIELFDKSRGTLSNDHGYFELHLDSLPALIKVSCLGYESKMVPIPDTTFLSISLKPTIIHLKEVQVKYEDYVTKLVEQARNKALKSRKNQLTGHAFYRQFNNNDSICTEVLESFYDVCSNNNGIKGWDLTQARYGIKDVDTGNRVYIYNQSVLTRFLKIYADATPGLEVEQPIRHQNKQRIFYELANQYEDPMSGQRITELLFRSAKNKHDSTYGHIFIDENTFDILKVQGTYIDKDNQLIKPSGWERQNVETIDKTRLDYEIRFKKLAENFVTVDYIKTRVSLFTIYKKRKINLVTDSFFYVYEYDPELSVEDMSAEVNDYENIKNLPYDPVFWFNNPIIKRNPIQQRLITEFERENIIGNLLN
ncbi:carboxypeptidase-like regulatory domain-containing protein [Solitalea sp. MAHUQ-68]|uniref:Carboxypeptidase-like regulatory domain-containing protein n=1 Tax=Solitalea agri TaxID=2953739 RepID=A0A9X2JFD9_9SPHI|nr:carboxypeptidase-like regulatory domain-containing protein [Solitalea agri]MCO4293306.1 carboxypeptidase-like regulatory domain-containing protein [Solitalea agri]